MGKKAKVIGTAAGVAAAATAAVIVSKQGGAKKIAERVRKAAKAAKEAKKTRGLPAPTVYHVKRSGDQWAVQAEGAARASSLHDTKREAVKEARSLATVRAPSQLVIHRADGSVQDTRNYEKED